MSDWDAVDTLIITAFAAFTPAVTGSPVAGIAVAVFIFVMSI